ncbi:MAG: Gfo/Idh/MocA family oxidoreductase [Trebonia sp.]|uniref:Gfo/Idh/MocA family protein n=1 Tax=Trebonia sp. TaxID=2767075 RepID=UPI003C7465A4
MKLLWRGEWIETPGYEVPADGVLIGVTATVPLFTLKNASGRQQRRPGRKVAVFLYTDGPRITLRKARTKREEPRFTGDFRVTLVLGDALDSGRRVVALASRVPSCAHQFVVHRDLVLDVPASFSEDDLRAAAARLIAETETLTRLCRQGYLYSATRPPAELVELLTDAVTATGTPAQGAAPDVLRPPALPAPPAADGQAADTVLPLTPLPPVVASLPVAVLGGGDYTRSEIIPALRRGHFQLYAVANREPQIAAIVGRDYGFALATTDSERAIAELPAPGLVVVATAHDSHTQLACAAVKAGHRVFLEKPPTVTPDDVQQLAATMRANPGAIEIGFNRRYHPLVGRARARLARESGPTSISCVVKELTFQPDHWYFWPNQGTRITGNLCHWIDLAVFLIDGSPMPVSTTLSPRLPGTEPGSDEERVLTVTFEDGSLLTVLGTTRGDDIRGVQEQMDIRRGQTTITIDDLWKYRVRSDGIERYGRTLFRDKAHTAMYREGLGRIKAGQPAVYPVRDMVVVSAIQIAASDLARSDERAAAIPDWISLAAEETA